MTGKDQDDDQGLEREPFLARWSKRKIDTKNQKTAETATPLAPAPVSEASAEGPFDPQAFELPIPALEEIVAGFDMRPFLQKGVPESLKNAALRKLWVTDPAIAGFVSPALDYAHDYNTPGAAPGFGPLVGDHDLTSLMQNLFSRDPKDKTPQAPQTIAQMPPELADETPPSTSELPAAPEQNKAPHPLPAPVHTEHLPAPAPSGPPAKSRHGSALPE